MAELNALLKAEISGFLRDMGTADASVAQVRKQIKDLEATAALAGRGLEQIRVSQAQAAESQRALDAMQRSVSGVTAAAMAASDRLQEMKIGAATVAENAAASAAIKAQLDGVGDKAEKTAAKIGAMRMLGFGAGHGFYVPFIGPGLRGMTLGRGLAGMGTIAGLAGFGAERMLTSTLGIGGSMVGGLAGGALLGLGALGTTAVGMGTDMAGIGQAAGDIKNVSQGLGKLTEAIQTYGRNSRQAADAQRQLNQALGGFSPVARNAVLAAAQTSQQFKAMFDKATGAAEKTGAEIINQAMKTGEAFLPTIGRFAAQNMSIIQQQLQPFFAWLQNPGKSGGLGVFTDIERIFQRNLPTSIHALTQGFELLMKTVDVAGQHIGGFMKGLDHFFTRMNGPDFGHWSTEVNHLIGLFDTWLHLFTALGGAIIDVFRPAVGFGQQFAAGLTEIVNKVREWLQSTSMQATLHTVFDAHLQQVKALFQVFLALLPALEAAIQAFLTIEGVISRLVAGPLRALADLIKTIMSIPFAPQILGWAAALYAAKAAITSVMTATGVLRVMLLGLGPAAAVGAATADAEVASIGATAEASTGAVVSLGAALSSLPGLAAAAMAAIGGIEYLGLKFFNGGATQRTATNASGVPIGTVIHADGRTYFAPTGQRGRMIPVTYGSNAGAAAARAAAGGLSPNRAAGFVNNPAHQALAYGGHTAAYWQNLARQQAARFGTPSSLPSGISAPGASGGGGSAAARAAARRLALPGLGAQLTAGIHNALAAQERAILGIGTSGADATATVVHLRAQAAALGHTIAQDAAKGINVTAVQAQLHKINEVLKRDFVPADVRQAISTQFGTIGDTIKQAMQDALAVAQQQLQDAQQAVSDAFQTINQGIDAQFQRNVQQHIATMQIMVNSPFGKFLFGGSITKTPAQAQLAALQQAHNQTQLQQALADAQKAVAAAQSPGIIYDAALGPPTDAAAYKSMGANTQALIDAQRQLADAQYNIQVDGLQTQAQAQQDAASTQLRDAQQAYQDQQDLVQQAMDQQVQAIETGMADGTIAMKDGWNQIKGVLASNGVDMYNLSFALGGQIYHGLNDAITNFIDPLLANLMATLKTVISLGGGTTAQQQANAGFNAQAFGAAQAALANGTGSIADVMAAAQAAGFTQSLGAMGRAGMIPGFGSGGMVPGPRGKPTLAVVHGGEKVLTPEQQGRAAVVVHLSVNALDPESVDWNSVADKVYDAFSLRALRQGGKLFSGVIGT